MTKKITITSKNNTGAETSFFKMEGNHLGTSIKYKLESEEQCLPYIELGCWLCSHFQLETTLNFHKLITQKKLYNLEE